MLWVCEASVNEIHALEVGQRLNTLLRYSRLQDKDITQLASRLDKHTPPVNLPFMVVKNVQALCFWARREHHRGHTLSADNFDVNVMADCVVDMELADANTEAPDIKPAKLKEEDWEDWIEEFTTYLSHVKGKHGAPIDYVIRPDVPAGHVHQMQREMDLYSYPLTGQYFREDNKTVFRLLSDLVKDQPAIWIRDYMRFQDGRAAWQALTEHYDGGGAKEKRINRAEHTIKHLMYENEQRFSFDKYSSRMLKSFHTLEDTPSAISVTNQVRILLDNMKIKITEVVVIKQQVRQLYRHDLKAAIQHISSALSELFQASPDPTRGRSRYISEADTSRRVRRRVGDFPDLQVDGGVHLFFGVDVTDVTRRFTEEEMDQLGPRGRAYVFQERNHVHVAASGSGSSGGGGYGGRGGRGRGGRGRGRGGRNNGRCGNRSVAAYETEEQTSQTGTPHVTIGAIEANVGNHEEQSMITTDSQTGRSQTPAAGTSRGSVNGQWFGAGAYRDSRSIS